LTEDEALGLRENITRLKAQRTLDEAMDGKVKLSPEGWFDLTILATGGFMQNGKNVGGDYPLAERRHNQAAELILGQQGP
jgi:hypothetical protein